MDKIQLIKDLKEKFNIDSSNAYPKTSYLRDEVPTIGCYGSELQEPFYIYNEYNKKYYVLYTTNKDFPTENWKDSIRYQVPLSKFEELKEIGEFKEADDANISTLTIRDLYAIIQNVDCSNKSWLNSLIRKSSTRT